RAASAPAASGSAARWLARSTALPSRVASSTSMATAPPSEPSARARAPQGRSQPPPRRRRKARSASTARRAAGSSIARRRSTVSASSARHSTARAPCATWGSMTDGSRTSAARSASPSRSRAANATTTASNSAALATRVSMFPRNEAKPRSGRRAASWAWRRTDPVPTRPPAGMSSRRAPTRASRGSARSGTAASRSPAAVSDGRSLAECTARSARPSSTACWTSLTNTPVPPMVQMGTSARWSPVVETITSSASAPRRPATRSACQRASRLPRVAMRRPAMGPALRAPLLRVEAEEGAQGVGVQLAAPAAGRFLHPDGRLVEELGHDPPGQRLDGLGRPGVDGVELGPEALQLGETDVLPPGPQRRDQRGDLAGGATGPQPLELGGDDPPHPGHLPAPAVHRALGEGLEVVHVEEGDAGDVGDARVDVAGDGNVDDQQRPAEAPLHRQLRLLLGDHDLDRSRRGEHEVGGHQRLGQLLDRDRPATDPDGQLGGTLRSPAGDGELGHAGTGQRAGHALAHLAGSENEHPALHQGAEPLGGQ